MLIAFNKPMNVLSQFTSEGGWPTLKGYGFPKKVYAAGRLDRDSEGLLLLTDNGAQQARLTGPKFKEPKVYFVLVENIPREESLQQLREGLTLKEGRTAPCKATRIVQPDWLWSRYPPVRTRKTIVDVWLKLTLTEGKNRQIRRMCAAIGNPVLRLVRYRIGPYTLDDIAPGEWRIIQP